ncbi:TPA: hypothetical protein QDB48_004353 [Burkholderia vietnamiensis]|nr:hypothetical protein [Burkholderia vietnamiensis]
MRQDRSSIVLKEILSTYALPIWRGVTFAAQRQRRLSPLAATATNGHSSRRHRLTAARTRRHDA